MKKFAAIDIGTNSMRLMLCETENKSILHKEKDLIITRIGKDVSKTGMLSERAIAKNIEALKYFRNRADKFGADRIIAIATSAVRDASNRERFVKGAKEESGIEVKVIQGSEEAELGLAGVLSEFNKPEETVLVIDIGGGSTELILGSKKGIEYSVSINAGTVRMTEGFVKGNPIDNSDMENMQRALSELFGEALKRFKSRHIDRAIAIGGTATTLGAIFHKLSIYKPEIVHNTVIGFEFVDETYKGLKAMSIKERHGVKGLQKERADVITAGFFILRHIMKELEIADVVISENDNLEGMILRYAE